MGDEKTGFCQGNVLWEQLSVDANIDKQEP